MKKIRLLLMIIVTLCVAVIGCSKVDDEMAGSPQMKSESGQELNLMESPGFQTWTENFDSPYLLSSNWTLYGYPQPKWVPYAFGKYGLFDNNGPSPTKNYAVSDYTVGNDKVTYDQKMRGYTLESEVSIRILNKNGSCICPGLAVSKELNPEPITNENGEKIIETGISMRLVYVGYNAIWFQPKQRGHTWFVIEYISEDGNQVSSGFINADMYSKGWHKLKIRITSEGNLFFFCNNNLILAPITRVHSSMLERRNIVLGYTSDGNPGTQAGIAYHNWVRASYALSPSIE